MYRESDFWHWKNFFRLTKPCKCGSRTVAARYVDGCFSGDHCADCPESRSSVSIWENKIQTPLYYVVKIAILTAAFMGGVYLERACEYKNEEKKVIIPSRDYVDFIMGEKDVNS